MPVGVILASGARLACFRWLFLARLIALHDAGRLAFFGSLTPRAERRAFLRHLSPVRSKRWAVYAKPPFAGPEAVLAYLVLHSSRRHFEPAAARLRRGQHHVPLPGLSLQWRGPPAGHHARCRRVHTPLPASCAATRVPPHPSLRPALRFGTQGQPHARTRTARRRATTPITTCPKSHMMSIRRVHAAVDTDSHRDLRALASAPCTISLHFSNREKFPVTRHGLPQFQPATPVAADAGVRIIPRQQRREPPSRRSSSPA
jgi:hypothetical protein